MTTVLDAPETVHPTLAIEPHDIPGLPPYRLVRNTVFGEATGYAAAFARSAWQETARREIRQCKPIVVVHQAAYEAAARVLHDEWERELVELAHAFELPGEFATPIMDDYCVIGEREPVCTLAARGSRVLPPSERCTSERCEAGEVRGAFLGHGE